MEKPFLKADVQVKDSVEDDFCSNNKDQDNREIKASCISHQKIKQESRCNLEKASTEYQQSPLFVNVKMNNVKKEFQYTDDMKVKFSEDINEEQKHSTLQDSKYKFEMLELEVECSTNSALSSYEDSTEPSGETSKNNTGKISTMKSKTAFVMGSKESSALLVADKEGLNYNQMTYSRLTPLRNIHKVFKNYESSGSKETCNARKKVHLNAHKQKIKCEYEECYKILSDPNRLKRHVDRLHKGIKNYQCHECCRKFFEYAELRMHINGVHKEYYECKECHKKLSGEKELKRHVNVVHKGIKKYQCDECRRMFPNKNRVKMHIDMVHVRVKNFMCHICSATFYLITGLQTHIDVVHKGVKKYECTICYKKFSRVFGLNTHINTIHKRITDYECYDCHKQFSTKELLGTHIIKVHKNIRSNK